MSLLQWVASTLPRSMLWSLGMLLDPLSLDHDDVYLELRIYPKSIHDWYASTKWLCICSSFARDHYKDPATLRVTKMRRYRYAGMLQDEFNLVAEIVPSHRYDNIYLSIERTVAYLDESVNGDQDGCPSRPSTSSVDYFLAPGRGSASRSPESLPMKNVPCDNTVTITKGWLGHKRMFERQAKASKPKLLVEEVSFTNTTIYDLCIAAHIVHTNSPLYTNPKHRNYWLGNLIVRVLAGCDPGSQQGSVDHAGEVETLKEGPQYKPNADFIEDLKSKYLEEKARFTQLVDNKGDTEGGKQAIAEELAEETKKVDAAEQRIRKLETEKKQLEDEINRRTSRLAAT